MAYMLALDELMSTYTPVYPKDGTWADAISLLLSNPADAKVVEALQDQYKRLGEWREPISLESYALREYYKNKGYPDDDPDEPLQVMNGTHRVAAAYLMNLPEVKVEDYMPSPDIDDDSNLSILVTEVMMDKNDYQEHIVNMSQDSQIDDDDDWFDVLRSLPISDELWITSSTMVGASGHNGTLSVLWDLDKEEMTSVNHDLISQAVENALKEHGVDTTPLTIMTFIDTDF